MHEVNNRLEALTNLIYLSRTSAEYLLRSTEYLDEADTQLRSLGEITRRSLGFIRLDIEAKEIDLVELATSELRLHQQQISKKRINVQTRTSESALAFVKRGEMFQVLTNLLLNAIDASPHSGNLHVRVAVRQRSVAITVADNGYGYPKPFVKVFSIRSKAINRKAMVLASGSSEKLWPHTAGPSDIRAVRFWEGVEPFFASPCQSSRQLNTSILPPSG